MLSVCVSQYGCLLHIVCHMTLTKSQFLLFSTLPNTQLSSNYTALYHCHRCRAAIGCSVFRLGLVDYKRHPQTPVYTNPPEQQPDEDPLQERRKYDGRKRSSLLCPRIYSRNTCNSLSRGKGPPFRRVSSRRCHFRRGRGHIGRGRGRGATLWVYQPLPWDCQCVQVTS